MMEPNVEFKPIEYKKEMVEHLVDQLIKLHRSYDSQVLSSKVEISEAMKIINKALNMVLFPTLIIKDNGKISREDWNKIL